MPGLSGQTAIVKESVSACIACLGRLPLLRTVRVPGLSRQAAIVKDSASAWLVEADCRRFVSSLSSFRCCMFYVLKNRNDDLHLGHVDCLFCLITGKVLKCPKVFVLPHHRQSVEVS